MARAIDLFKSRNLSMSEFRFVQTALIVILGLGVTEILRNIGNQISRRAKLEIYPLQIFVSCSILLFILMWLWNFSQSIDVRWTLPVFLLQMIAPIALALSAQIVGLDFSSKKSPEEQYFDNCTAIYLILAIVPLVAVFTTMTNLDYMPIKRDSLILINVGRLVESGFIASLGFIKKPVYHWSVVVGLLIVFFDSELKIVFELNF